MKKKTIVSLTLFGIFLIGLVALAPYLFHKPQAAKTDTVVASSTAPRGNPVKDISQTVISKPIPAPAPNSKVVSERKDLHPFKPEPRKIRIEQQLPIIKEHQSPQLEVHPVTLENETPIQTEKSDPVAPVSADTSKTTDQPSRWGATVLATNSGVDVGVCYRLAELPILGETGLDVVVGTQQAGIGLSKEVYQNLGVGIVGTVAYENGAPEVGVYVKYSF